MLAYNDYPSEQTFQSDSYVVKTNRFEYQPEVKIQPEPIIDCTIGGFVNINPVVKGTNLTYSWQIVHPNNYFEFLANEHYPTLRLGPINKRHLTMRYRMLATDAYGNGVYTNVSTLQLMVPIRKVREFQPVILDSHPISPSIEKNPFKEYESFGENNSSNIGTLFQKIASNNNTIIDACKDANISLDQMNSQENIRNPNIYLPVLTSQPQNTKLRSGQDLFLECTASNARSFTWYFNAEPINEYYSSNSLRISRVTKRNGGIYSCVVRNEYGFVMSDCVTVSVME